MISVVEQKFTFDKVHDKANEWFSSLPEEMSAALVRHFGPMPPRTDDHAEFEVSYVYHIQYMMLYDPYTL